MKILISKDKTRYEDLLEVTTDYVYTAWVEEGRVVSTEHHPGCIGVTGYTPEEFTNDPNLWSRMIHVDDQEMVIQHANQLLSGERLAPIEHRIIHKNGSMRWVMNTPVVCKDELGRVLFYEGIIADITKRKQAEQVVVTLSDAVKHTADNILITDQDGVIIYANPSFERETGYSKEEVQGKLPSILKSGQHSRAFYEKLWDTILSGQVFHGTLINKKKNGELYHVEKSISPIKDSQGKITYFVSTGRNITEKIRSEEKIKASLKEKEVLLKEIHHRVKNNLAIISGFLGLQADRIKENSILDLFKQAQDRIYSMSLIHEKLYQSKSLAKLEANDFIRTLAEHLVSSYVLEGQNIKLRTEVESVWFSIDEAIPCGLIINELITNALKHAFSSKPTGEICVCLENLGSQCRLSIADNGKGIEEDLDLEDTETLGLMLVNGLTGQLKGTLELDRSSGTRFRITFPLSTPS
ncbi:MAG: PAS domain S-box protein [SAR324 cluster bacterium]|nr:PAS domain S-box protein [SAR324 cluster bacterium]